MTRRTLTSQVRELNAEMKELAKALARVTDGATLELVFQLSRKFGKLDALCGLDRMDRGLPYEEDPPVSETDDEETSDALMTLDDAIAAYPERGL